MKTSIARKTLKKEGKVLPRISKYLIFLSFNSIMNKPKIKQNGNSRNKLNYIYNFKILKKEHLIFMSKRLDFE